MICDVQNTLINNAFLWMGNDSQKEKYCTRLAADTVGSFCLSEWGSGTDAFALKTAAKEDGADHFRINGAKAWITNAAEVGFCFWFWFWFLFVFFSSLTLFFLSFFLFSFFFFFLFV